MTRELWVAGPGPHSSLCDCRPAPLAHAPHPQVPLHSCLPKPVPPGCPVLGEPCGALTRHHSSRRLLIETMCGAAGQGGGSSGSQAWPGACGPWEDWGRRSHQPPGLLGCGELQGRTDLLPHW